MYSILKNQDIYPSIEPTEEERFFERLEDHVEIVYNNQIVDVFFQIP